jgi:dUTP pyrophosphatase
MTESTEVHIKLGANGKLPVYATAGSAGCDLYTSADFVLRPGETRVLPLDFVIAIEPGVEAQIRPRSGLSLKSSLRLPNSPGTIDSDYRSEVGVIMQNTFSASQLAEQIIIQPSLLQDLAANYQRVTLLNCLEKAGQTDACQILSASLPELAGQIVYLDQAGNPYGTIYVQKGERIAQMVFSRCLSASFADEAAPENIGHNRGGGFGSTGMGHIE